MKKLILVYLLLISAVLGDNNNTNIKNEKFINACEEGNYLACYSIGLAYYEGTQGLHRSIEKSKYFAEQGCYFGFKASCDLFWHLDLYRLVDGKCSNCGSVNIGKFIYGVISQKKKQYAIDKGFTPIPKGCSLNRHHLPSPRYKCLDCDVGLR